MCVWWGTGRESFKTKLVCRNLKRIRKILVSVLGQVAFGYGGEGVIAGFFFRLGSSEAWSARNRRTAWLRVIVASMSLGWDDLTEAGEPYFFPISQECITEVQAFNLQKEPEEGLGEVFLGRKPYLGTLTCTFLFLPLETMLWLWSIVLQWLKTLHSIDSASLSR